jgi:hypothetical protein
LTGNESQISAKETRVPPQPGDPSNSDRRTKLPFDPGSSVFSITLSSGTFV